jgi:hypothetical protein
MMLGLAILVVGEIVVVTCYMSVSLVNAYSQEMLPLRVQYQSRDTVIRR